MGLGSALMNLAVRAQDNERYLRWNIAVANDEHLAVLRQGTAIWNRWRERNPDIRPDLAGVDLYEADLIGIDLAGAFVLDAKLSKANLSKADLTGTDHRGGPRLGKP